MVEPEGNQPVTLSMVEQGMPTDETKMESELVMQTAGFIMETFVPSQGVGHHASGR